MRHAIAFWVVMISGLGMPLSYAADTHANSLHIESAVFANDGPIPKAYTCKGQNISPPLAWSGAPESTKSLALILDDPDAPDPAAPKMTFVHWVLYGIPAGAKELPENVSSLPQGTQPGMNDAKSLGYHGPCPPIGKHRYIFKLYALDIVPALAEGSSKAQLEQAMQDHILAQSLLIGTYAADGGH